MSIDVNCPIRLSFKRFTKYYKLFKQEHTSFARFWFLLEIHNHQSVLHDQITLRRDLTLKHNTTEKFDKQIFFETKENNDIKFWVQISRLQSFQSLYPEFINYLQ
mgnify:CR=1 FL=1